MVTLPKYRLWLVPTDNYQVFFFWIINNRYTYLFCIFLIHILFFRLNGKKLNPKLKYPNTFLLGFSTLKSDSIQEVYSKYCYLCLRMHLKWFVL